ncbi:MAG: phenylacetate--CoA ligase family protein, partial [Pikeienuella sp.]
MTDFYDDLETRSSEQRAADLAIALPKQIANAIATAPAMAAHLGDIDPASITDRAALATLPVLRKSELSSAQKAAA